MAPVWWIGFIATFCGVSIGGIIVYFMHELKRSLGTIYALCTGFLLGLLSFSIVPEALALGNWWIFVLGFVVGALLFRFIHALLALKFKQPSSFKTGLLLLLIIAIHNFPIGAILGTSGQTALSHSLLQTLILHNIPEGMILFTLLFVRGFRFLPFLLFSVVVAIPVAIGAMIGEWTGGSNTAIWSLLISITVGTIYMVTMKEILPESVKHSSNRYSVFIAVLAFFAIGLYLLNV